MFGTMFGVLASALFWAGAAAFIVKANSSRKKWHRRDDAFVEVLIAGLIILAWLGLAAIVSGEWPVTCSACR